MRRGPSRKGFGHGWADVGGVRARSFGARMAAGSRSCPSAAAVPRPSMATRAPRSPASDGRAEGATGWVTHALREEDHSGVSRPLARKCQTDAAPADVDSVRAVRSVGGSARHRSYPTHSVGPAASPAALFGPPQGRQFSDQRSSPARGTAPRTRSGNALGPRGTQCRVTRDPAANQPP